MKVVEGLEQHSTPWHHWRQQHIGGSDACLIAAYFLDDDWPYGSWPGADLYKLWRLKTGQTKEKPDFDRSWDDYVDPKAHGKSKEQGAREWYMGETGHICLPICVEHSETNFVGASLDGAVDEKRIVEIKCPTEPETFEIVKAGRVPPQYLAQVQHNLYAAEADVCDFVAFFKGEGAILSVTRNEKYITQLINSEQMFWDWVTDKKFPVGDGESNRDGDEEWKMCVERYLTAQAQVRFGEHNLRRAKVGLMRAMNSSAKVRGAGVTVSMRVKSGYVEQKPRTVEEALILTVAHLD